MNSAFVVLLILSSKFPRRARNLFHPLCYFSGLACEFSTLFFHALVLTQVMCLMYFWC